ncbi:MAG: hypothetical protein CME88_07180 [Hirschia sp.]|mgnify:CR=1 FL=1|nr:hypothetical protein [Hirschia sp.]MBF18144.1 hypothetical protein [Hirschia sp.]
MSAIAELLDISSPALGPDTQAARLKDSGLQSLLQQRNGFFALQNALWVFSDNSLLELPGHDEPAIADWLTHYPKTRGCTHCFAVDAIGYPFVTSEHGILRMDLETGVFTRIAPDIEGWARLMLAKFQQLSAWAVCKQWQDIHGPLPDGHRLLPRMPFVGGGTETADNLLATPLIELIRFYSDLATQIRNMPEGGTIEIRLAE